MTAAVEHIRQQIDLLAPAEVQELMEELQHDFTFYPASTTHTTSMVRELSATEHAKLEALRQDIQIAAEQLDRGEGKEIDWDAFLSERHRAYAARQAS